MRASTEAICKSRTTDSIHSIQFQIKLQQIASEAHATKADRFFAMTQAVEIASEAYATMPIAFLPMTSFLVGNSKFHISRKGAKYAKIVFSLRA